MTEPKPLSPDDIAFLRMVGGGPNEWADGSPMVWGAAMSVMIEDMHSAGYVTYPDVQPTDKGRAALKEVTS